MGLKEFHCSQEKKNTGCGSIVFSLKTVLPLHGGIKHFTLDRDPVPPRDILD